MATKTHWKKLQNPDYIGAYSLMESGTAIDMDVTIKSIARQQVTGADGKKDECTVAQLIGQKPFIINATNSKTIAKLYDSPFIEDWVDKKITLYVALVKVAGDKVEALRIRPVVPKGVAQARLPELTPAHEKWNGAKTAVLNGGTNIEAIRKKYELSAENEALLLTKPLSITLGELIDYFNLKRPDLSREDIIKGEEILNEQIESRYSELHELLKAA